jgi:hypothetical protein
MPHLKIVTLLTKVVIGLRISISLYEQPDSFGKEINFVPRDTTPILQCRISGKSVQLGVELYLAIGHRDGH